ncbi:MAG TPA: DUF1842 domain-containing protein [Granulicella sp.]|jgi:hypothetical protein|nr:DUF1842 domain-containing protein [Granulicella sp.]
MAEKIGYYLVDLEVSTGLIGAPILHLKLGVNAVTGIVQGTGEITQPLPPPHGSAYIPQISGVILHTGFGEDTMLVALQGEYLHTNPPSMVVYPVRVTAALAVDASWTGTAVITNGNHTCNDCKVTVERGTAARTVARQEYPVSSN